MHVTMSYRLNVAGIMAYRTVLAVLLLLSDVILWVRKHQTNRYHQLVHSHITHVHYFYLQVVSRFLRWFLSWTLPILIEGFLLIKCGTSLIPGAYEPPRREGAFN